MAKLIITIDGPAGSGKSSTAGLLAQKLGAAFLDTGAMYRAAVLAAMQNDCNLNNVTELEKTIDSTNFKFEIRIGKMTVQINGKDVTEQIRDQQVTANVRFVASQPSLRSRLVEMQRVFAAGCEKIVTEGRDQGTVAFPNADFKFFLTADNSSRAKRRAAELSQKGLNVDLQQLQDEIEKRDVSDENRSTGPLIPAEDAVKIDNTNLTLEETVDKILNIINKK